MKKFSTYLLILLGLGFIFVSIQPQPAYASLWKLLTARWGSGAGEVDEVRIDAVTNSLNTIDYAHHEIHSGTHFTAFLQDDSVASGAKLSFEFKTPNTAKLTHFTVETTSSGQATTILLENASSLADGDGEAAVTAINRERDSGGASGLLEDTTTGSFNTVGLNAYVEAVGAADHPTGTTIDCYATGSGNKSGGISRSVEEFLLKRDTVYGVVMESKAAGNSMIVKIDWYEHTGIN